MKPLNIDIAAHLITYGVAYYLHNHPTEPDNFNTAIQTVVAALNALEVAESDGQQVISITQSNFVHQGNGVFEITVNALQQQVTLGTLLLRDDNGVFEFSNDGGATWQEVGSGASVTDHTLLTNIGVYSHDQLDAHLGNSALHTDTTDHALLTNIGTHTHDQIDSHITDVTLHPTDYLIHGDGLSNMASNTFWVVMNTFDHDALTLIGIFTIERLATSESFWKYQDLSYGYTVIDFGKNSLNQLYLTLTDANTGASQTIYSLSTLSDDVRNVPQEYGVMIDRTTMQVAFIIGGKTEAPQSITQAHAYDAVSVQHLWTLGDGFQGDCYWFGACADLLYPYSSSHTPMSKGLEFGRAWVIHYPITIQDNALVEQMSLLRAGIPQHLPINGTLNAL